MSLLRSLCGLTVRLLVLRAGMPPGLLAQYRLPVRSARPLPIDVRVVDRANDPSPTSSRPTSRCSRTGCPGHSPLLDPGAHAESPHGADLAPDDRRARAAGFAEAADVSHRARPRPAAAGRSAASAG